MNETTYNRSDATIFWLYTIGISIGILIAVVPYIFSLVPQFRSFNLLAISRTLRAGYFLGSISHVLLLAVLGFALNAVDKTLAGSKVQTAGYLHTLISFLSIFSQVKQEFTLDVVLYPIGAALITSILGWFLGSEIITRGGVNIKSFQNESEKLASELSGFRHAIHKIHEDYVKILMKANQEFSSLHKEQSKMYKKVNELAETAEQLVQSLQSVAVMLKDNLGDEFESTISSISEKFSKLSEEIQNSTNSAKNVAEYLNQGQILINQLEALFDLIKKQDKVYD
jgi:methyl-accepting chemotaxis protein